MPIILLIDDDAEVRSLVRIYFQKTDYTLLEASSGQEGIDIAYNTYLDCILSDIDMPGLSGFDVAEQLCNNPLTQHIPFIFLTSYTDRQTFRRGMELGADDFLTKPIYKQEILSAIKTRLHRRQRNLHALNISTGNLRFKDELLKAIETNQLELYFQPQLNLLNHQVVGVEALVRWQHPLHGLLSPDKFITFAEQHGLIEQLNDWVLRRTCWQARLWSERWGWNFDIAVNLAASQFGNGELVANVEQILTEYGLNPTRLRLELTEGMVIQDVERSRATMLSLKNLGVKLELDDFGTGYSSLSYLRQFPLDSLKIDRSFIKEVTTSRESQLVAIAIIQLGQSLNLEVIAEGIETAEQELFVLQSGCHKAQGFLYSHPLQVGRFEDWLVQSPKLVGETLSSGS